MAGRVGHTEHEIVTSFAQCETVPTLIIGILEHRAHAAICFGTNGRHCAIDDAVGFALACAVYGRLVDEDHRLAVSHVARNDERHHFVLAVLGPVELANEDRGRRDAHGIIPLQQQRDGRGGALRVGHVRDKEMKSVETVPSKVY